MLHMGKLSRTQSFRLFISDKNCSGNFSMNCCNLSSRKKVWSMEYGAVSGAEAALLTVDESCFKLFVIIMKSHKQIKSNSEFMYNQVLCVDHSPIYLLPLCRRESLLSKNY